MRIKSIGRGGRITGMLQGNTGLTCHGVGGRVDFTDSIKARQRQHDLIVMRRLAANQSGVAALRHDRGAGRIGELEKLCDLGDGTGTQHHRRAPAIEVAHFDEVRKLGLRIGDCVFSPTIAAKRASRAGSVSACFGGLSSIGAFPSARITCCKRWQPSHEHARTASRSAQRLERAVVRVWLQQTRSGQLARQARPFSVARRRGADGR